MASKILSTRILLLNGSQSQWTAKKNAILKKGEPGVEFIPQEGSTLTDVKVKIGDGVTTWEKLPYLGEEFTKQYVDSALEVLLDNASLDFNSEGKAEIAGFANAGAETLPQKTADGKIVWKAVSAIVEGDGNTVTQGDGKSIDTSPTDSTDDDAYIAKIHGFDSATDGQVPHKVNGAVVWKDVVTKDSKSVVTRGSGIDITSSVSGDTTTYTVKHDNTSDIENLTKAARTYVTGMTFDEYGHVTAIETSKETVTNTAHNHTNGSGTKVVGDGGIDGDVKVNLNIAMEIADKTLKIYDADDSSKTALATLDASEFIKDGMLDDVSYDAESNTLTFTWNTDGGKKTDTVTLTDILDPYTEGTLIKINGTQISHGTPSGASAGKTSDTAQTPDYGATFNIPVLETDAYGHIVSKGTTTVKIPDKFSVDVGVTQITSNDSTTSDADDNKSGLKITPSNGTGVVNIEIDDEVTFILDGGTAANL